MSYNSRASVTPFAGLANLFPSTDVTVADVGVAAVAAVSEKSRGPDFMVSPNLFGNPAGAINVERIVPKKKSGYQPCNCIECPRLSSPLADDREPYRIVTAHIEEDPLHHCGTIGANNQLKLWKATELPVKLKKVEESITFFYSEKLDVTE